MSNKLFLVVRREDRCPFTDVWKQRSKCVGTEISVVLYHRVTKQQWP